MGHAVGAWGPWLWVDHLPMMGSQSLPPWVPPSVPRSTRHNYCCHLIPPAGHGHSWVGRAACLGHCKALSTRAGSPGVCSVGSCLGASLSPNLTPVPHASCCTGHNALEVTPCPCWLGLWAYEEGGAWLDVTTPKPGSHLVRPPVPGLIFTPQVPPGSESMV